MLTCSFAPSFLLGSSRQFSSRKSTEKPFFQLTLLKGRMRKMRKHHVVISLSSPKWDDSYMSQAPHHTFLPLPRMWDFNVSTCPWGWVSRKSEACTEISHHFKDFNLSPLCQRYKTSFCGGEKTKMLVCC